MTQDVLLIAGCSHIAGAEINGAQDSVYNRQYSFGNALARKLGKIPVNIGHHSISNAGIARSVMTWIDNQLKSDYVNLSVLIAWTDSGRMELVRPYEIDGEKICRAADWFDTTQNFVYNVNYGTGREDNNTYTNEEKEYFQMVQRFMVDNPLYLEISTITSILMLQNYLKLKGIEYLMCNSMYTVGEKETLLDYYIKHIDQSRYYNFLNKDECFYWKYKNLGYENPKAKYWHHNEVPHELFAEELYKFAGENHVFSSMVEKVEEGNSIPQEVERVEEERPVHL